MKEMWRLLSGTVKPTLSPAPSTLARVPWPAAHGSRGREGGGPRRHFKATFLEVRRGEEATKDAGC